MAYIIISTTVMLFGQIFQCLPLEYNWLGWKGDFGPHHCLDINTLAFLAGGLSISHDIIILLLPLPLLWGLNMSKRSKAGIFVMFSLGIFILITSCVRLRYIAQFTQSLNPTWDFTDPLIWSGIEVSVSMIVVCLPALRVLFKRIVPRMFSTAAHSDITGPKKASYKLYPLKNFGNSVDSSSPSEDAGRREAARENAARIEDKRRKFFSFRSTKADPNESELELGDKVRGEVRTQIRHSDGESSRRRSSMESGIHVRTTTTFYDGVGGGDDDRRF
ncbi:hypothetical protein EsH8_II_000228 [Colletotrichum jinshuiense]